MVLIRLNCMVALHAQNLLRKGNQLHEIPTAFSAVFMDALAADVACLARRFLHLDIPMLFPGTLFSFVL